MPLVSFVQLTDIHITDAQSTIRAEFLDRLGDPDSPLLPQLGVLGTYRPHERFTAQVLEAMVQAVRNLGSCPLFGGPLDAVVLSGDVVDNAQENELAWLVALLEGGREVRPDSGDPHRDEGVGGPDCLDERYWHPEPRGTTPDLPRRRFGFPEVPGLFEAARKGFSPSGLPVPWWLVPGNHDVLLAGTVPPTDWLRRVATGGWKPTGCRPGADLARLLVGHEIAPPAIRRLFIGGPGRPVTSDVGRRPLDPQVWPGRFEGPFAWDLGAVRFLALDTVDRDGGWQGSVDDATLLWLEQELVAGHRRFLDSSGRWVSDGGNPRAFVLVSHHPLECLVNPFRSDPTRPPRVLGGKLLALLGRFPNVLLWIAGHTHRHRIRFLPSPHGSFGIWAITTASLLDWPQQGRVVELALDRRGARLLAGSSVLDHLGPPDPRGRLLDDPLTLAAWSRELALNTWHRVPGELEPPGRGQSPDRNVVLELPLVDPDLLDQLEKSALCDQVQVRSCD
jgi:3',5'-cyclic AMP phosphodiesterase CpdA